MKNASSDKPTKTWYYIYMQNCMHCTKLTPIIDTLIACGKSSIHKIDINDFRSKIPQANVRGTPAFLALNEENNVVDNIAPNILSSVLDLSVSAPELLTANLAEYILSRVEN